MEESKGEAGSKPQSLARAQELRVEEGAAFSPARIISGRGSESD